MAKHELKTWPQYFERLLSGEKTFEVRKDDRGFQAGDLLVLREWSPSRRCSKFPLTCHVESECDHRWTGRELTREIGFIYHGAPGWLDCGEFVVLSLLPHDPDPLPDWEREFLEEQEAHRRAVEVVTGLRAALINAREIRDLTLRDVMAQTGVPLNTLSRFERGIGDIQLSSALKLITWLSGRASGGEGR